jgi:hypothetical protein
MDKKAKISFSIVGLIILTGLVIFAFFKADTYHEQIHRFLNEAWLLGVSSWKQIFYVFVPATILFAFLRLKRWKKVFSSTTAKILDETFLVMLYLSITVSVSNVFFLADDYGVLKITLIVFWGLVLLAGLIGLFLLCLKKDWKKMGLTTLILFFVILGYYLDIFIFHFGPWISGGVAVLEALGFAWLYLAKLYRRKQAEEKAREQIKSWRKEYGEMSLSKLATRLFSASNEENQGKTAKKGEATKSLIQEIFLERLKGEKVVNKNEMRKIVNNFNFFTSPVLSREVLEAITTSCWENNYLDLILTTGLSGHNYRDFFNNGLQSSFPVLFKHCSAKESVIEKFLQDTLDLELFYIPSKNQFLIRHFFCLLHILTYAYLKEEKESSLGVLIARVNEITDETKKLFVKLEPDDQEDLRHAFINIRHAWDKQRVKMTLPELPEE